MKKVLPLSLFFLLLLFLVLSAGVVWVLKTDSGLIWLLNQISDRTGTGIKSDQVQGNLWDGVRFDNLELSWDEGKARIGEAHIRLQPLSILKGEVSIKNFFLKKVRIQDNRPEEEKPLELVWPDLPRLPAGLRFEIDPLRIEDFVYRRLDEIRLQASGFSSHLTGRGGRWTFRDILLDAPFGRAEGSLSADLPKPSLDMDISLALKKPAGEINRIALTAKFRSSDDERLLAGNINADAFSGSKPWLNAAAEINIRKDSIEIVSSRIVQPGRKGEVFLKGEIYSEKDFLFRLSAAFKGVDLAPEISVATNLHGNIEFSGNPEKYQGSFAVKNSDKEWRAAALSGTYTGNRNEVSLIIEKGNWLEGSLTGEVKVDWKDEPGITGAVKARELNPALFAPEWKGVVNLDLKADLRRPEEGPVQAEFSARFIESSFRGQVLTGRLDGRLLGGNLNIITLSLQGKGFNLEAEGELTKKIAFRARISDLSGLLPGTAGRVSAEGWLRKRNDLFSGTAEGKGQMLSHDGIRIKSIIFSGQMLESEGSPLKVKANASGLAVKKIRADKLTINAEGLKESHTVRLSATSGGSSLETLLRGGYAEGAWQGKILELSGRDPVGPLKLQAPAALRVSSGKLALSAARLRGATGEQMEISADIATAPLAGTITADWKNMNLDRVSVWLQDLALKGKSSGSLDLDLLSGERMNISADVEASGEFRTGGYTFKIRQFVTKTDWNQGGLRSSFELQLRKGGRMDGRITSATPARMGFPEQGEADANLKDFDIAFFRPWIPPGMNVEGRLSGKLSGKFRPGKRFSATGTAEVAGGEVSWKTKQRLLHASAEAASLRFVWQEKSIRGDFTLALREYGKLSGSYSLPVAAAFPVSFNKQEPIAVAVKGNARESGMVSSFFPGLVQESSGDLAFDLRVGGTGESPSTSGSLSLKNAGAYLPSTGIHLKELSLAASLSRDRIVIDAFQVSSGKGMIQGKGVLRVKDWKIVGYQGEVSGKDFQTVYLPDLRVWSSPDLKFEGTPEKISVRGEIRIPELLVREDEAEPAVQPSSDVVIVDDPEAEKKSAYLPLDVKVKVILGDQVLVKAEGIDAKLGGSISLTMRSLDNVTGEGAINVVKGTYKRFGVNLDITRGRFFFAGGRIGNPSMNILAIRKVGEISAGVAVTGTLSTPVVDLYSEPAMPDTDILAYIVLGHPLGQSGEQAGLLMRAAGVLLSSGQATSLQEQIRGRLGLDVLAIQPGETESGVVQSMVTVGKYLSPKLFISYGRSLFTDRDLFRLRYTISDRWEVETRSGDESGIDLYYKIDFK